MKLGIMSDSHGRAKQVRRALAVLDQARAEAFIHCGDVGSLEVLEELAGRKCWFVWGNTDYPHPNWRAAVEAIGLTWPEGRTEFVLAGKRIAVFHGHERVFHQAVTSGQYDYVLHGHLHQCSDLRAGSTRVINPGALYRAGLHTVAVLDLETDQLDFIDIDQQTQT